MDLVPEFGGETADNRQAKTKTRLLVVDGLAALKLEKDGLALRFGNARTSRTSLTNGARFGAPSMTANSSDV